MFKFLARFFLKRLSLEDITETTIQATSRADSLKLAEALIAEIQGSLDYSINNENAVKILESIVRSQGNKITDFILKD